MNACNVLNRTLTLNGTGVRKVFTIEVYKAYLYSEQAVRRREEIAQEQSPYRLAIHFSYGPISAARMRKARRAANLTNLDEAALERESAAFSRFFDTIKEYRKGDVVHYDMYQNELSIRANEVLPCRIASRT